MTTTEYYVLDLHHHSKPWICCAGVKALLTTVPWTDTCIQESVDHLGMYKRGAVQSYRQQIAFDLGTNFR